MRFNPPQTAPETPQRCFLIVFRWSDPRRQIGGRKTGKEPRVGSGVQRLLFLSQDQSRTRTTRARRVWRAALRWGEAAPGSRLQSGAFFLVLVLPPGSGLSMFSVLSEPFCWTFRAAAVSSHFGRFRSFSRSRFPSASCWKPAALQVKAPPSSYWF